MKKLKTILVFSVLILSLIYACISITKTPISKYKDETSIAGHIRSCMYMDKGVKITLMADEKIIVNYYNDFNCKLGQKIKVTGKLKKPSSYQNFNLFNYQNYLYSQKINYIMTANNIKIIDHKINNYYKIKNSLIDKISTYKSRDYLNALILGNNKNIEEEIMNSYQSNGISHLLAISGMHIALLSSIVLMVLNKLFKRKKLNYIIVIVFLLLYLSLLDFIPSATRAVILFIVLTIGKIFNIKLKPIYILLLTCSAFLFYNPYIIYNIGFLFSFIITFYLILFSNFINKYKNYISKTFIISLIAFLASIPILINNFFNVNLLSPFINVIFVPLVSIIIYPLCLMTLLIKPLDDILYFLIEIMEKMSLIISKISIFNITLGHINIYVFILYYLIITYIIYCLYKGKTRVLVVFIIVIIIHSNINYLNSNTYVTVLDVGQGDSILISMPHNNSNILIDTGGLSNSTYSLAQSQIIPYLKSNSIKKLSSLIITHGDYDHMGEAINLVNNFKVENVIFNCGDYNDLEKELISVLEKKKINYYSCIKELNIDKYKLQFLNTDVYDNENDNSSVIYLNYNNYKFLFVGDAGVTREKDILEKYNLDNIDFLKVGHHGSNTSSSEDFINSINPKYSLISVGKNNRYGHPKDSVLDVLSNSKIYRTDTDGSIEIKLNKREYKIRTCPP